MAAIAAESAVQHHTHVDAWIPFLMFIALALVIMLFIVISNLFPGINGSIQRYMNHITGSPPLTLKPSSVRRRKSIVV
jgi:hypothetical protein